jgi:hypothetical protein
MVISAAFAASVGGDAGGSLTSWIDVASRPPAHGRGSDINGRLRATVAAAADGREHRSLRLLSGAIYGDGASASASAHSVSVAAKSAGSIVCIAWPICGNER